VIRVCFCENSVGKPDAGNRHVRFDEREKETGDCHSVSHRAFSRLYPISEHSAAPLLAVIATQPQTPPAAESAAPKINQPAPPASSALHVRSAWDSHQTSAPAFGCSPRIAASPPPPS
jgi:hypothetical protein